MKATASIKGRLGIKSFPPGKACYELFDDSGMRSYVQECHDFAAAIAWAKDLAEKVTADFDYAPGIYIFVLQPLEGAPSLPIEVEVTE